jgi:hypothetical protein
MKCAYIVGYHITIHLSSKKHSRTILGSATILNGGIRNGGGTDPEITSLIHQRRQDPVIPKVNDHSSEFPLMDSAGLS